MNDTSTNYGVNVPSSGGESEHTSLPFCGHIGWQDQRSFGIAVDELGYDSLAVPDHLMTGSGATTECLTTLTGLAVETDEVSLYPKTINNHLRHGPLLAKAVATLDTVSEGRVKLGMGAGWKRDEAVAYGYTWPEPPERLREMAETIELMKRLWTEDEVTYRGDFYRLDGATCKPHPSQDPHPPIMVGGGGEQFTLRIAAEHADTWNYYGGADLMERKLAVLRDHCEDLGRPFDDIETSWFGRCIVRETDREVERLLEEVPRFREEHLDNGEDALVGTPAEICEQLQPYLDLGFEEIVVEFVDFPETTGLELFADEVVPYV